MSWVEDRTAGKRKTKALKMEIWKMEAKKTKSQSTGCKWSSAATLRSGEQWKAGSSNPISATLAVLAVCLHALACGPQMSLIPADSSCEFLMPGSHTFFPGRSQAASACICDSSPNPTSFPPPMSYPETQLDPNICRRRAFQSHALADIFASTASPLSSEIPP